MTAPADQLRAAPRGRSRDGGLLAVASCLLLLLAAAQGYVSFRAQYTFVDHTKHAPVPSILEALGLDTGAVIFALLALSLARRGRRGTVERVLNVACAIGSLIMNLLAADLHSPRSITVWVLPSVLYALASDRLIAVVRRWVQASDPDAALDGSAWQGLAGIALWVIRLVLDVPGTVTGFRRWVLAAAPVAPGVRASLPAPGTRLALSAGDGEREAKTQEDPERNDAGALATQQEPAEPGELLRPAVPADSRLMPGEKKRQALIRLYERSGEAGDPRYGNRRKAAELAGEIAAQIGYHPGTARRELARYLASRAGAVSAAHSEAEPTAEEVA